MVTGEALDEGRMEPRDSGERALQSGEGDVFVVTDEQEGDPCSSSLLLDQQADKGWLLHGHDLT